MEEIYFDNQLLARPSNATLSKMEKALASERMSHAAPYWDLRQSTLKEAYEALYRLVGASFEDHLIITSSGAEAVNHVLFAAYLDISRKNGKNHFMTSNIDEASAILAMTRLQEFGCVFHMAPANKDGIVSVDAIAETITPRTALLSLSWANALTGVIQPVEEIAKLCRDRGILFHVDATHIIGKGNFSFQESGADLLSFNGEQIHAPRGIGALFVRNGVEISPFILGGGEQGGMRGGGLSQAQIVGLGHAAQEASEMRDHLCMETARLRDLLEKGISVKLQDVAIFFKNQERLPNITAMGFPMVTSEALLFRLTRKGLLANMGGGIFQQMIHILKACGIDEPLCHGGLSFSLSRDTTEEEIKRGVEIISESVLELQKYAKHLFLEQGQWD